MGFRERSKATFHTGGESFHAALTSRSRSAVTMGCMKPRLLTLTLAILRGHGFALSLAFLLHISASFAFAQNGAVNGHVTDGSSAAIQGAQVSITSTNTAQSADTRTNNDGYYQFPTLVPGSYVIHVNTPGFAHETVEHIRLEVGGSVQVNVTLKLANVTQDVVVTANAPELMVDHPDRGVVVESEFVETMPLNIRNPLQMVNFTVGVTQYSLDSGNNDASQAYTNTFRINGGKIATTESLLDGGANTTQYDLNAIASVPQVDSIQEFKVLTDAYAPEWGHTSGGVVTYSTKSGTNQLHGSVFEYIRNGDTDANSFAADLAHAAKPHFERNQFGYAFGGPAAFPPHYRDANHRTFFFQTYEALRQSQAGNFTYTVPTMLERQGDFSQSHDAKGNLLVIYDPSTTDRQPVGSTACTATPVTATQTVYCRTPFTGNKIPAPLMDTVGKAIMGSYPMPNQPGLGLSSVNNFFSASPTSSIQDTVNSRLDHKFSDKHSVFLHFDWFQRYNYFGDPYANGLSPTSNHQRLPGDNTMLDHTWVLSPSLVFEHHFVYAHQESNRIPETLGYDPTKLGFNSSVSAGLASTTFPAVTSAFRLSPLGPQGGLEADGGTTYEYAASLNYLKGKHSFKFGFDYRLLAEDYHINQLVSIAGNSNFTGGPYVENLSNEPDSGSGVADLLLGTGTITSGFQPGFHTSHPYNAFYAQDEYHVTPKLSLTYGLRYNIELPDTEAHNQFQFLNLNASSPLNSSISSLGTLTGGPGFVGTGGTGSQLQNAQFTNFDPRLGFAYSPDNKTVVRGGFGIFHAPSFLWLGAATSQGNTATTTSIPAAANGVTPLFNMDNPFPNGLIPVSGNSLGLATNAGLAIAGFPRNQINSYSSQWSFDLQRQLPGNFVVTLGYVGNSGTHLYVPYNYNQLPDADLAQGSALTATVANPFSGVITTATSPLSKPTVRAFQLMLPHPQFTTMTSYLESRGHSSYNAMQLTVEHRFSQGLSALIAYTHSKMMDNVADFFSFLSGGGFQDNYCSSCDRSVSAQDLRNVLRASGQYELPFGKDKRFVNEGAMAQVVGGWSVGSFFTFDDGLPVQVTSPANSVNSVNVFGASSTIRPMVVPGVSTAVAGGRHITIGGPAGTVSEYFNAGAFSATPAYTFGNAARYQDSIRLPGNLNFDMLAAKRIFSVERFSLNFKAEFFNAFNRVQFTGLNTSYSASGSAFGYISPTNLNSPRSIQGSLRLIF
jgi:hypothetical protein